MKKHFLILLALISVHIAQAQTSDKAMKLYEQTKTKINSLKNYSFSFTMLSGENYFDGNIKVKGEKFKIELEGLSMIYDGQKTYNINPQDKEVNVYNQSEDMGIMTPSSLLSYFKTSEYNFQWDIEQQLNDGRKIQFIKLTPKSSSQVKNSGLIGIDIKTNMVYKIIEIDAFQGRNTLTINNFKSNLNISDSEFQFKKSNYPGYYVYEVD
ncbi:MAG TPA: outer membrane lipoprotein carrier protein LolA [Flavobacterium sp.]|nr:outer membrane lipoprotein carrier protein LolA [Flavobacterium sp.]